MPSNGEPGRSTPLEVLRRAEVHGAPLTVRVATLDDVARVLALYRRLSADDLHLRFFTGFRPTEHFVTNWLDRSRQGGTVLIAVEGDPRTGRVVADAGYVPTAIDTAELAITVDPDRRGWLGAYLLDALVEHAREHGIANLTAEVLTSNCRMLGLLRARGCAFEPSDDASVARVVIGTAGPTPVWSTESGSPRILIEGSAGSWHGARDAAAAGLGVMVCPGPERGRSHTCPVLLGERCPLADGADAVIVVLPPGATTDRVLDAHEADQDHRDQPVALSEDLRSSHGDLRGRVRFDLDPLVSGPESIAAAREAIAEARDETAEARDHSDPDR